MKNFDFISEVGKIIFSNNLNMASHYINWKTDAKYNTVCPDVYVGEVTNGIVSQKWFDYNSRLQNNGNLSTAGNPNLKTIVLVLESPHEEEYDNPNFINPALGKTGDSLQENIDSIVKTMVINNLILLNETYRIILMNSIQYQCSLGKINGGLNKKVRDSIFKKIWSMSITTQDFQERLKSYKPDIIFNLCTKGISKPMLRDCVQIEIDKFCQCNSSIVSFIGCHPCCWWSKRNRKFWLKNDEKNKIPFK